MATIYEEVETLKTQMEQAQADILALQNATNNSVTALEEGTDLHELAVGDYYIPNTAICATILNRPITNTWTAFVRVTPGGSDGQKMIYYYPCSKDNANYYMTAYYSGAWGDWHEVNAYDSGWIDLTLADGITAYSDAQKPRYRRIGKEVILCGVLKGVAATDTVVATLPTNFRPAKKFILPIACVGQMIGKISIETSGNIIFNRTTIEPVIAENWHSIACSFTVD